MRPFAPPRSVSQSSGRDECDLPSNCFDALFAMRWFRGRSILDASDEKAPQFWQDTVRS